MYILSPKKKTKKSQPKTFSTNWAATKQKERKKKKNNTRNFLRFIMADVAIMNWFIRNVEEEVNCRNEVEKVLELACKMDLTARVLKSEVALLRKDQEVVKKIIEKYG